MKKFKEILVVVLAVVLAVNLVRVLPAAYADRIEIDPMFTYGETLTKAQYEETKRLLGVEAGVEEIPVRVNELNNLLQDSYPYHQVYSSTYITPAKNQGGVTVEIVTPQTITEITPAQYQNAAITAGAVDVNIKVASAVRVDGSGALAGVYKSFKEAGHALDSQAISVAQDELELTAQITAENEDDAGYSDELLNAAIAEIKAEIAEQKEANQGSIDQSQVQTIVQQVVNNYNLSNVISEQNIQLIVNQMNNFSQLSISPEQKEQLLNFGSQLQQTGGQLFDKAKTAWDETDKEEVRNFFQKIWDWVVSFFE